MFVGSCVMLVGIVTDVSDIQPWNEFDPIDVSVFGIEIDGIKEQPLKALFPIEEIEVGIFTDVNALHPWKPPALIFVIDVGSTTVFNCVLFANWFVFISVVDSGSVIPVIFGNAGNVVDPGRGTKYVIRFGLIIVGLAGLTLTVNILVL